MFLFDIILDCICSSRPDRLRDIADRFNVDHNAVLDNVLYARAYTSLNMLFCSPYTFVVQVCNARHNVCYLWPRWASDGAVGHGGCKIPRGRRSFQTIGENKNSPAFLFLAHAIMTVSWEYFWMWHVSDLYLKSAVSRVKINSENCLLQCSDVAHQYPESAASQLNKMWPSYQLVMYPGAEGGIRPHLHKLVFQNLGLAGVKCTWKIKKKQSLYSCQLHPQMNISGLAYRGLCHRYQCSPGMPALVGLVIAVLLVSRGSSNCSTVFIMCDVGATGL